jgi:TolB protein
MPTRTILPLLPGRSPAFRSAFLLLGALLVPFRGEAADSAPHPSPKNPIAFERGREIWIAEADGTNARQLARGSDPSFSPDGKWLAFTRDDSTKRQVRRSIVLIDPATGKSRPLESIPGGNAWGAEWSADGRRLIVSAWLDYRWTVLSVGPDDRELRILRKGSDPLGDCWMPVWGADGASWYCHDLERIRHFAPDGEELAPIDLASHVPQGGFNSGCRLALSPDGKSLLVDVDMDEEGERPGWDGPPPAIFRVDLSTGEWHRVSPVGLFAWEGSWLPDGEVVCDCIPKGKKDAELCRLSGSGDSVTRILAKARHGSAPIGRK